MSASPNTLRLIRLLPMLLLAGNVVTKSGCHQEAKPVRFEPNLIHSLKYEIQEGVSMEQVGRDAFWVVTEMFGTPDAPKLPAIVAEDEDLSQLVSLDNLQIASGDPGEMGRGLYQTHCVSCHGVTGNGRGTLSATMQPYPRDYRKGVFKFKSTERGSKPTRADLRRLIANGIPGTPMVAIPNLTPQQRDALVDYVIYLSWRGELERTLIDDAFFELDIEEGDRLIVPADRGSVDEAKLEAFEDSWELAEDYALEIAEAWQEAEDDVVEVPAPPADVVVAQSHEDYVALTRGDQAQQLAESVARGKTLFAGKIAACGKCHGEQGRGDGQNTDYDDWTKEWTTKIGLDPKNFEALVPLMAEGALNPVNAKPRNFELGVFHGGGSPEDLYRRITQGIEGSPMPAATFVPGEFEENNVWDLINYIRSLHRSTETEVASGAAKEAQPG